MTAIVAILVQYQVMSNNNIKYDRLLYDKCQTRLEDCNQQRIIEAQDYINRIERYSEIINKVRDEINDKTRQVEKLKPNENIYFAKLALFTILVLLSFSPKHVNINEGDPNVTRCKSKADSMTHLLNAQIDSLMSEKQLYNKGKYIRI